MNFQNMLPKLKQEKIRHATIIGLCLNIVRLNSPKLILNDIRMMLTEDSKNILENSAFNHPLKKLLLNFLTENDCYNENYFKILEKMLININNLISQGMNSKKIMQYLRNIEVNATNTRKIDQNDYKNILMEFISNDFVSNLVLKAINTSEIANWKSIRVLLVPKGTTEDSFVKNGFMIKSKPLGTVQSLENAKISLFKCGLDIKKTELKSSLLLQSADQLENYTKAEDVMLMQLAEEITSDLLVINGRPNELILECLNKKNIAVLRLHNKHDIDFLAKALNTKSYNALNKEYAITPKFEYKDDFTFIEANCQTIVLKNSVLERLVEFERKISQALVYLSELKEVSGGIEIIGENVICSALRESIPDFEMDPTLKRLLINGVIEFLITVFEIDDYLIAQPDELDVKPKQPLPFDH